MPLVRIPRRKRRKVIKYTIRERQRVSLPGLSMREELTWIAVLVPLAAIAAGLLFWGLGHENKEEYTESVVDRAFDDLSSAYAEAERLKLSRLAEMEARMAREKDPDDPRIEPDHSQLTPERSQGAAERGPHPLLPRP